MVFFLILPQPYKGLGELRKVSFELLLRNVLKLSRPSLLVTLAWTPHSFNMRDSI